MLRFSSYRFNLLTQSDNLFSHTINKEELFQKVLNELKITKQKFTVRKTKFILYFYNELAENIYLLALAKEEVGYIPVEGVNRIEERSISKAPFVYLIIDHSKQIILIQDKKQVFQDPEVSKNRLEFFFNSKLGPSFVTASISPISDKQDFWRVVESSEGINELNITLNAPNLFKGRQKAEDLVKELKDEFNITDVSFVLKNEFNKLKITYDDVKNYISLASAGGGKYVLKYVKNGKTLILKSFQFIKHVLFDDDDPTNIDLTKLTNEINLLDSLNDGNNDVS